MKAVRYIVLLLVLVAGLQAKGQVFTPYQTNGNYDEYTSLDEALKEPEKVQRLVLRRKGYKEVPKEIYKFKNLVELDLKGNKLTALPDSLGTLTNLRYLNVARNNIATISTKINGLKSLVYFELGQNMLTTLPLEMGGLDNLEYISLWENEITRIPGTFGNLEKLKEIDLRSILLSQSQRDQIKDALPEKTIIFFSPDCNCKQ